MQKDILRLIWDIRGKVDKAINNHDVELYEKARKEFLEVKNKGLFFKSMATQSIDTEYETQEAREYDIECNVLMMLHNLNELRKDVVGEEREEHELQFFSIAEILWYTREMYDVFILNAELKCVEEDENKKLFQLIEENLKNFLDYYSYFKGAIDVKERITIIELLKEINQTYREYYAVNVGADQD